MAEFGNQKPPDASSHQGVSPSISLIMIVKNEETILGECLSSVRGLVDEMIVVDTGSTDHTKLIAKSVGAKVFDFPWVDHFAIARNESVKHSTGDWLLMLDADEAIFPRDHAKIKKAITSTSIHAYNLPIWNYLPHKDIVVMERVPMENPFFEDPTFPEVNFPYYAEHVGTRLFRRPNEGPYMGKIHETPHDYFLERQLPIENLDVTVHHFGKMLFQREQAKTDYYLEMALLETKLHPEAPRVWHNLFQQALIAMDSELVLEAARKFMRLHGKAAPAIIYIGSGMALREQGKIEDSLACFDAVLKHEPDNIIALRQRELSLQLM